jgi:hypothetical protein
LALALPYYLIIWEDFMADHIARQNSSGRLLVGFVAGFFATLTFHQLMLSLLWAMGVAPFGPFPMAATKPFGVPVVLSLSFWGGVWGVLFAFIDGKFPQRGGYWITAFIFGAIFPSLVALMVVLPIKGRPMGGGWHPALLATALLINGAWGVGTGLFLKAFGGLCGRSAEGTGEVK